MSQNFIEVYGELNVPILNNQTLKCSICLVHSIV